jgi:drug/metabolite transporter (DMT)-like permease
MFTIYALKYDISHESFMVFIFAFGIWFGVLFLGEWFTPLLIIAILIITIVNIVRATR